MSKILLIGGGGYVGLPVAEQLIRDGFEVVIADNFCFGHSICSQYMLGNKAVEFYNFDITQTDLSNFEKLYSECVGVVVLAGLVGDPITKKYPNQSEIVNSVGIQNLLTCLLSKATGQRVVFISTCSNYGLMPEGVMADEDSMLNPLSLYAAAKVQAEQFVMNFSGDNAESVVLRFATAFGLASRMRFDLTVNQFARDLATNNPLNVFDADTWRPYCHVKDFGRLISKVLQADAKLVNKQVFNAGGDNNNFTKRQIVDLITSRIHSPSVEYSDNGGDPRNYRVNFEKVHKALGFDPEYTVEDGIDEIIGAVRRGFFNTDVDNNFYGNYLLS